MYTVSFWSYSKKENSTDQPDDDTAYTVACDLMDGSGMLAPTLVLDETNPTNYNYAYIREFSRYYFINNWRYSLGLWTAELQVDVLASWKSFIRGSAVYVARSASQYNNSIRDTTYPMQSGTIWSYDYISNPFNTAYGHGYFVAGIVNTDNNSIGAISYYAFTASQFRQLLSALMGDVRFYGVTDISDQLTKVLANPFQYIVSCRWMPMGPPQGTLVSTVPLGWWSFNVGAYRLGANVIVEDNGLQLTIPRHPESSRGVWLNEEPYTEHYLVYAPFGAFSLPPDKMLQSDTLTMDASIDYITGAAVLTVTCGGSLVTRVEGVIGTEIALAQMAPNMENIMSSIPNFWQGTTGIEAPEAGDAKYHSVTLAEAAQTAVNGHYRPGQTPDISNSSIVNAISNVATGIANAYISSKCPAQISGTNGGISAGRFNVTLHSWFRQIGEEDIYEKGRPLCQYVSLFNLSGFVQCGETDIAIPCTKPELSAIKAYMAAGFFLE